MIQPLSDIGVEAAAKALADHVASEVQHPYLGRLEAAERMELRLSTFSAAVAILQAQPPEVAPELPPGISCDPDIMDGEPCFTGTRIPLRAVVSFHEAGYPAEKIAREYPSLSVETISQAIALLSNSSGTGEGDQGLTVSQGALQREGPKPHAQLVGSPLEGGIRYVLSRAQPPISDYARTTYQALTRGKADTRQQQAAASGIALEHGFRGEVATLLTALLAGGVGLGPTSTLGDSGHATAEHKDGLATGAERAALAYINEHLPRCYSDVGGNARRTAFLEIKTILETSPQGLGSDQPRICSQCSDSDDPMELQWVCHSCGNQETPR